MDLLQNIVLLQWLGTAFGVVQVLLARSNNIHHYLFGIVSIVISILVLYGSALYADVVLNLYYLAMSVYGWVYWKWGRRRQVVPITVCSRNDYIVVVGIVVGCFLPMAYWLRVFTDSNVPYWDALVSTFAWAGMWLLAKRKLENWTFLNLSNLVAIPLLLYKGLYIYAGLTVFLFTVAVSGYFNWKRLLDHNPKARHINT